ncbi:PD-(D/E)XK nuclease-like domain-containing protein [Fructobacillus sp. CRL 2054]|uniref:PD-(D/E)XK nuclease-like domain-containing protein n=1 Tax=Fructobacillus sp. CRL 2054 TaxID=2763007 RepID=UPI002378D212|nr:PD-(D/E)XK nuclease-like domain-containing protein [Fructobacillus sp. CRL 2054]MDD9139163.1 PD-(D/E)XK nuclease-like domain-containing protein [Fructobacillus sp. CRL 2054]
MTDQIHMSPTRAFKFSKNPLRAYQDYIGQIDWWEGSKDAVLFGTLVHNVAEGMDLLTGLSDEEKDLLISKTGKTKGQLKKQYQDAEIIGKHLRDYASQFGQAEYEVPFDEESETGNGIQFTATGRADMLTENAVFDFKTVAPMDFNHFRENDYQYFRDNRQEEYKKQIAWYAFIFEKEEAHLLYVAKNPDKPFIYDYKMDSDEIKRYADEMGDEIEQAVNYINDPDNIPAVNDGSKWAFGYFGGVITND